MVASVASTFVIVIVAEASEGHRPDMRTLVGLAFSFLFLSVMADFAPQVAGPLGALLVTTSLVVPAPGMKESAGAIFLRGLKKTPAAPAPAPAAEPGTTIPVGTPANSIVRGVLP